MTLRSALAACLALAALAAAPAPDAFAYVHVEAQGGVPVHWERRCIPWWLDDLEPVAVDREDLDASFTLAFAAWDDVSDLFVDFQRRGATCFDEPGLADVPGVQNVMIWREGAGGWPYPERVVALTSLTYSDSTGIIVDADVEMNAEDYPFAVDGSPAAYDLQQAATHEVGHLLGLGHSLDPAAVMHAKGEKGDVSKRVLTSDDVAGVLSSHPPGALSDPAPCEPEPAHPLDDPFCVETHGGGCGGAPGSGGAAFVAGVLFALAGSRRRLRPAAALAIALGVGAALAVPSRAAFAWEPFRNDCGIEARWFGPPGDVLLDPNLPEGLDPDEVTAAFEFGFRQWTDLDCLPHDVAVVAGAPCPGEGLDDGMNCVFWVPTAEEWADRELSAFATAITLVHFVESTAEIVDADLAVKAFLDRWEPVEECSDVCGGDCGFDLTSTATHEAGHFLGLDHSGVPGATMADATFPGDCAKRTLHPDDLEGICAIYAEPVPDPPEQCPEPEEADAGGGVRRGSLCGGAGGGAPWQLIPTLLALLAACALGSAPRSRRRSRPGPRPSPARS